MAFDPQEQEIIRAGIAAGKSTQEMKSAVALYRTGYRPPELKPVVAKEEGFISRTVADISERGESIVDTLSQPVSSPSEAIAAGTKATATAFGAISSAIGNAIKSIPGGSKALDAIGGVASEGFKNFTDSIADTKFMQRVAASDPSATKTLEKYLSTGQSLGEIASNILVAEGIKSGAEKITDVSRLATQKIKETVVSGIDKARPATKALYERSSNLIKPSPTPTKAMGEVLQGKKPLSSREFEAFRNIDTTGVKTYAELDSRIKSSIGKLSSRVDEFLAQDPTPLPLDKLITRTTSGSGRIIERNFVSTAIEHLKELYLKSADDVALSDVDDLLTKAQSTGLTRLEVNDISRLYNQEFGSKAFSKVTGEPLTSVSAQAYENIRSGLKDVARKGMGGAEAEATDKIISSLYNTRELVSKNVAAVQKLQQRIAERGLLEKVGHAVSKYGDLLTGGSLRGFIGGLLPRGAGYKILNALDLEERLSKNLQIIRKAIESGSDDAIIVATKELGAKIAPSISLVDASVKSTITNHIISAKQVLSELPNAPLKEVIGRLQINIADSIARAGNNSIADVVRKIDITNINSVDDFASEISRLIK